MALDNIDARMHVNKMCFLTGTFVIDAGTNGMNGQAYSIFPGVSKCYQCQPKQKAKSYQFCTIRALPTEPIHCFIWAKMIFNQLIGKEDEITLVKPAKDYLKEFDSKAFYEICLVLFKDEI